MAAGRTWVAAEAPVYPPERLATTAAAFAATAAQHRRRVCYFGAQERLVQALAGHRISAATVKGHVGTILDKLGVTTRVEAIARAWTQGLVRRDDPID